MDLSKTQSLMYHELKFISNEGGKVSQGKGKKIKGNDSQVQIPRVTRISFLQLKIIALQSLNQKYEQNTSKNKLRECFCEISMTFFIPVCQIIYFIRVSTQFQCVCVFFQEGASKKDRDDFLSEAAIVAQFNDPNVISIEGVVLRGMQGHVI